MKSKGRGRHFSFHVREQFSRTVVMTIVIEFLARTHSELYVLLHAVDLVGNVPDDDLNPRNVFVTMHTDNF